ncbi:putative reverse transcriptase domain-containing protein, partial [Tanacetum coccineum]
KRHEENSNLIKEIRATINAAIRNQGASIKTLEIQIRQMSNVLQERGFGILPSSTATNPRDQVKSILTTIEVDHTRSYWISQYSVSTGQNRASISVMPLLTYHDLGLGELAHTRLTMELADKTVKYPKGSAENVLVGIGKFVFLVDFIILDMPEDIKVPLILGRPFLSTGRTKIDVYKRKITLRVGEENIIFKSVKPASSLIRRVYMLSFRERMELDLEVRLMGETLVLNRLLDPFLEDYIELTDLNEPYELRRNQGDDLIPTIKEGEVIEEFRTMDEDLDAGIDDYPRALMNVPIFVGTFSVVTDFAVLEDMDAYRDEGMGDVIVDEPFLREVRIKAKRFDGMITIYNVYSDSKQAHLQHLATVFQEMRKRTLFAKRSKCVFGVPQVEYLGHVISAEGVATNPSKIQARRLVAHQPLTTLLKKNLFGWNAQAEGAFQVLKQAMVEAPVLTLPDFHSEFTIETDASA